MNKSDSIRKSDRCRQDTLKAMFLWSYYSPGMMLIGSLGGALVLWFGTAEVLQHRLSVGELVMFISYLALFYVPINQIHSVNHMLQHALAASERVFEVLDLVPEVRDRPNTPRANRSIARRRRVSARQVSLSGRRTDS